MTEDMIRAYCDLRARKLAMTNAQKWVYTEKVVELWMSGAQCETALTEAAKEIKHA